MLDTTLHYCMDYDLWIRLGRLSACSAQAGHFRTERINRFLANSRRYLETESFSRREPMFQEIYTVVRRSFCYVLLHWKACHAYYRLVDLSWPLARWALWPARRILPNGVHHWLRKELLVLLDRVSARQAGPGVGR